MKRRLLVLMAALAVAFGISSGPATAEPSDPPTDPPPAVELVDPTVTAACDVEVANPNKVDINATAYGPDYFDDTLVVPAEGSITLTALDYPGLTSIAFYEIGSTEPFVTLPVVYDCSVDDGGGDTDTGGDPVVVVVPVKVETD